MINFDIGSLYKNSRDISTIQQRLSENLDEKQESRVDIIQNTEKIHKTEKSAFFDTNEENNQRKSNQGEFTLI